MSPNSQLQPETDHERMLLMQKDINYIKEELTEMKETSQRDMQTILLEIKQTRNKCPGEQCIAHADELDALKQENSELKTRLSIVEERWKIFIGIIAFTLVVGVPVITWIMDKIING